MASVPDKRLLSASAMLYPLPVVVVTCGDADGERNAITLAWVGTASSEPPHIVIGIRPTRFSFGLVQRYGDFVVNVPRADQAGIVQYCGSVSGRNEDKFSGANITAVRGERVRAPLIREFPVNIECKVKSRISLGSHDLFLGEIVAVHAQAGILVDGQLDVKKADPLSYVKGLYYRLGEQVIPLLNE